MPVSAEQLQAVRDRADILRVVGAYVDLKKKGSRHVGLCPFHGEKTPSFSVSPDKGLYYCFGCHAGGDVISFVMRHQGLDFQGAVRKIAADVGVELEPESEAVRAKRKQEAELTRVNEYAQAFFEHALWQPGGERARAYLKERNLPEAFARERKLGFGGATGELLRYLEAKKVPIKSSAAAGLLSDDNRRALFDGRLTFPIFDSQSKLAGFGARRLGEGSGPKYINTRESALFSKRKLLYGWDAAQEAIRRTGRVVLVEGYTDVLACQQAGAREAVAALGTAFTEEHAKLCSRLAKDAVVLFDADAAGQRASLQVVERLLSVKLRALVAALPAGRDPDNVLREGGEEALRAVLDSSVPALEHFIDTTFGEGDLSIEEKARAAQELAPLLHALGTGLERDLYSARLAERVGVTVEQLEQHMRQAPKPKPKRREPEPPSDYGPPSDYDGPPQSFDGPPPGYDGSTSGYAPSNPAAAAPVRQQLAKPELDMLRELLLFPQLRPRFTELAEFASDPMRLLLDDLADPEAELSAVLPRHVSDERAASRLVGVEPFRGGTDEEMGDRSERTFTDVLNRFKVRHIQSSLRQMRQELRDLEARAEPTDELMRRIQNLTRQEKELKRPGSMV